MKIVSSAHSIFKTKNNTYILKKTFQGPKANLYFRSTYIAASQVPRKLCLLHFQAFFPFSKLIACTFTCYSFPSYFPLSQK